MAARPSPKKRSPSRLREIRRDLVEFARRLYESNLIVGTQGNLSVRLDGGQLAITPAGANKGYLRPEQIVLCKLDGEKVSGRGKPSSEIEMHLAIYNSRPDVMAVCHAHPVFATAFSVSGKALDRFVLPEIVAAIGAVPLAPYATPGTRHVGKSLEKLVEHHDAFLLESHGVVTLGKTLQEAFHRIEIVEWLAQVLFVAEQLGDVRELPQNEIRCLLALGGRLNIEKDVGSRRLSEARQRKSRRKAKPVGGRS